MPHVHPQQPYPAPQGRTVINPAQVGELQAPVGPILGSDLGPVQESAPQGVSYIPPKPPIPIWAIVIPVVVVVVIVVIVVSSVIDRNKNSAYGPYYSNTTSGSTLGGAGSSSCASQGTLSNGCDRCLLGSSAAGNYSAEGMSMVYSYNDDGTVNVTASFPGIPDASPISTSGTWYCSNGQFCVNWEYGNLCAGYSVNGSTVSWGGFSYDINMPSIPVP